MKKELTCNVAYRNNNYTPAHITLHSMLASVEKAIESTPPVKKLATLYSRLLEQPVSPRRTLRFLNAQTAAFLLVSTSSESTTALFVFLVWMCAAIISCRKA